MHVHSSVSSEVIRFSKHLDLHAVSNARQHKCSIIRCSVPTKLNSNHEDNQLMMLKWKAVQFLSVAPGNIAAHLAVYL